jgi:RNA polymerase sigma factor (sigma-70 family)
MTLAPVTQFRVPSRSATARLPVAVEATSDHELMIAVRAGEIRRLGDLFERYHQPLYGFFVRLTNQPSVGEDLVQIVFYRILKYRHTYRDEGKFSAWIYHLARKVAADHFRKHASTPIPTDPADLLEQPDAGPSPPTRPPPPRMSCSSAPPSRGFRSSTARSSCSRASSTSSTRRSPSCSTAPSAP